MNQSILLITMTKITKIFVCAFNVYLNVITIIQNLFEIYEKGRNRLGDRHKTGNGKENLTTL